MYRSKGPRCRYRCVPCAVKYGMATMNEVEKFRKNREKMNKKSGWHIKEVERKIECYKQTGGLTIWVRKRLLKKLL